MRRHRKRDPTLSPFANRLPRRSPCREAARTTPGACNRRPVAPGLVPASSPCKVSRSGSWRPGHPIWPQHFPIACASGSVGASKGEMSDSPGRSRSGQRRLDSALMFLPIRGDHVKRHRPGEPKTVFAPHGRCERPGALRLASDECPQPIGRRPSSACSNVCLNSRHYVFPVLLSAPNRRAAKAVSMAIAVLPARSVRGTR